MTEQNFEQMRRAMVASQLRTTGVDDPRVLAAMGAVPRERFVPRERIAMAYTDALIPLGNGRELNNPMSLGRLLSEAAPQERERALVIGAATGYSAAVLARMVASVTAIEEEPALLEMARQNLGDSGVTLVEGPLTEGHPAGAPYDLILIDGAVEYVPDAIVVQLVEQGGRLAAAMLVNGVTRLSIGRRAGEGFGMAGVSDWAATVLPGFCRPRKFSF